MARQSMSEQRVNIQCVYLCLGVLSCVCRRVAQCVCVCVCVCVCLCNYNLYTLIMLANFML